MILMLRVVVDYATERGLKGVHYVERKKVSHYRGGAQRTHFVPIVIKTCGALSKMSDYFCWGSPIVELKRMGNRSTNLALLSYHHRVLVFIQYTSSVFGNPLPS